MVGDAPPPPILSVPEYDVPAMVADDVPPVIQTVPISPHKSVHSKFLLFDVPPERELLILIMPPPLKKYLAWLLELKLTVYVTKVSVYQVPVPVLVPLKVISEPTAVALRLLLKHDDKFPLSVDL